MVNPLPVAMVSHMGASLCPSFTYMKDPEETPGPWLGLTELQPLQHLRSEPVGGKSLTCKYNKTLTDLYTEHHIVLKTEPSV